MGSLTQTKEAKSLTKSQNREAIDQIIQILFQIDPNLKNHVFEDNEIFFREDELALLNRYFPFLFDKTLKDDCDFKANQKILLIPPFLFYTKNKELELDFIDKYASLLKGFILTEHPIFLYELTKLAWDELDKRGGMTIMSLCINTGEFFIQYSNNYTKPKNFGDQFEASLKTDFNYERKAAKLEIKKLLKKSGVTYVARKQ